MASSGDSLIHLEKNNVLIDINGYQIYVKILDADIAGGIGMHQLLKISRKKLMRHL